MLNVQTGYSQLLKILASTEKNMSDGQQSGIIFKLQYQTSNIIQSVTETRVWLKSVVNPYSLFPPHAWPPPFPYTLHQLGLGFAAGII